jgi:hypothetical protein
MTMDDDDDVALWSQENNKRDKRERGGEKMENPKIEGREYGTVFECKVELWSLSKVDVVTA